MTSLDIAVNLMRAIDAYAFDYKEQGKLGASRRAVERAVMDLAARHTLTPADAAPHTKCKHCAGTCVGEQDGNRIVLRCIQCRAQEE